MWFRVFSFSRKSRIANIVGLCVSVRACVIRVIGFPIRHKTRFRVFVYDFISLGTELSYQLIVLKLRLHDNYDNHFTMNHRRELISSVWVILCVRLLLLLMCICARTSKGHGKFVYAMSIWISFDFNVK